MASRSIEFRVVAAMFACGLSLASAGCAHKKVLAAAPVAAAPQPVVAEMERPMNIAPDTSATPPPEGVAAPPTIPAAATNPPPVTVPRTKPAPAPRKPVADQPAAEPAADQPAHPPAPQILPQLSASDLEAYQRKTNEDLGIADQNLHQADGKQLSAAQKDLVEKISSFLEQSRDAVKSGDWTRAQNLAQKARLLSLELVNSL
jgi:outer membrane biosynthesis protein TonB